MTARQADHSLGDGVYYASVDYRGLTPRILIVIVDLVVLFAAFFAFAIAFDTFRRHGDRYAALSLLAFFLAVFGYLTVLKATFGTAGYWLTGSRIVNLRGQRPSVLRMTLRLIMFLFFPISFIGDFIWCMVDEDRQTLRDRFAGTFVIRWYAEPIGNGAVHLTHYHAFGLALAYPCVMRPKSRKD
jgi:uncharacterized RDD family membrane protein YckC